MFWFLFPLAVTLAAPAARADVPPIAPAYVAQELTAVGHVSPRRPAPGAGTGLGGCTGTLVASDLVLTAAHCVAGRVENPADLYITFGWRSDGPPLWRGTAAAISIDPDFRPGVYAVDSLHNDIAVIRLPRPVPVELVAPLPLVPAGEAETYSSFGYLAGADTLLRGHSGCNVLAYSRSLWGFDCTLVSGFSGGPLIFEGPDGPAVAAVLVAILPGSNEGYRSFAAIPSPEVFPGDVFPE